MANNKQKLELTWIGKDEDLKLEPRILIEDPDKSYGDPSSENMLIHGDNLLALKALEQEYSGKIKCIYIDPPYNTGSAFEHYDDNLEHSKWLNLMAPRLELLKNLLHLESGVIWVSIDDNEQAYLKVLMDEIFGRNNFLTDVIWNSTKSVTNTAIISNAHTHNLVYFKNIDYWIRYRTKFRLPEDGEGFSNPDNDPRGPWKADPFQVGGWRPNQQYEIKNPNTGKIYKPNKGCSWKNEFNKYKELLADNRIVFGRNGEGGPQRKRFLSEALERGKVSTTLWTDLDTTTNGTQHSKKLFGESFFSNPKPEDLIKRILDLSTEPGDFVLDSFLGSGTTVATAHKMGRKWIGIELGEHAYSHCFPRLKKVIDGEDKEGISSHVKWNGGGGFKFYELAPSLLKKDSFGTFVIDEQYNANMLAAAMCKHESFKYSPDQEIYWKQGRSTETDFIFVTTTFLTPEQLTSIHDQMKEEESLLVCAKSFAPECENLYSNVTVKKIPQMILGKCEFGVNNYDLNIIKETEIISEEQE